MMECGAYSEDWHLIHLLPHESVQAGIDVRGKILMPIHWGKFSLAYHAWNEPIKEFSKEAVKKKMPLISPQIGGIIKAPFQPDNWWSSNTGIIKMKTVD
jgi:hypothetical protein